MELEAMASLKPGWDSYGAPVPSPEAIANASKYIASMTPPHRLQPSVIGGVGATWYRERDRVYVEFLNDGRTYVMVSDGISDPEISLLQ